MTHNESFGRLKIVIYETNRVLFQLFYIYRLDIFYNPSYYSTNDLQFSI